MRSGGIPHSDSGFFDDPELAGEGFGAEGRDEPADGLQYGLSALVWESEHNDAEVFGGGISADVGEIHVEGQDCSFFQLANGGEVVVVGAAEVLIPDGDGVVSEGAQEDGHFGMQVFVCLEGVEGGVHAASTATFTVTVRSRASSEA